MASFLDWYLNDMERVDPAVKRELRRSLEDNDPSLDRLAISTFKYDDFDDFTYVPINDEWQKDGIALGKHTHVKKMWFRLPDDLEEEKLRAFCAGMATNKSVEHLDVSWKTNGADLIRMLTPFFSKSGKLCSLRFHGWAKDSRNPARCLSEVLRTFSTLTEFSIGESDLNAFNDSGVEEVLRALDGHSHLEILDLHKNDVTGGSMDALAALLTRPSCSISELNLRDCSLDDASAARFAAGMAENDSLRRLTFGCTFDRFLSNNRPIKGLSSEGWGSIFDQLRLVEKIDLAACKLDGASACALGDALAKGTSRLRILDLAANPTITSAGWQSVFSALPCCNSLEDLDIGSQYRVGTSDGFDDEDILSLAAALGNNRTLKKLQLHRCLKRLSTVGWNAIASILRNSHSGLETLLLGGNGSMGNQALMTFADALSCNKKLDAMYIDVSVSDIDDEPPIPIVYDWEPLAMVLCNRTSIAATFNSNHTLQRLTRKGCRYYSSEEWRLPSDLRNSLIINRENGPVEAARRKILDVHFGGEFSMDPFLEMDLKVVPRLVSWMARDDHGSTLLFQYVRRSACLFERTTPSLEMQSAKRMKFAYV